MPQPSTRNRYWVPFCILVATTIIGALVYFAYDHKLEAKPGPQSLCPRLDAFIDTNHLMSVGVLIFIATAVGAFLTKRKVQDTLNTLLFFEMTLFFGWITSHTGGLGRSIYGPGYLALFPVATIVPRTAWIKFAASVPIAFVAFLMACYAPDVKRELFIWASSIVGCSLGWGIQQLLYRVSKPDITPAGAPERASTSEPSKVQSPKSL